MMGPFSFLMKKFTMERQFMWESLFEGARPSVDDNLGQGTLATPDPSRKLSCKNQEITIDNAHVGGLESP